MRQNSLLVIFLVALLDLVSFGILLPVMPFMVEGTGGSAWKLGLLMTAYTLTQFVVSPFWGWISDALGRRPVILFSLFATMISFLLMGLAGSVEWLFIARIIAGGFGATLSTAYAHVFDVTMERDRVKGFGMMSAAFGLGQIFGPPIGGALSRYGNDVPMYFAAGLAFFNLVFAFFMVHEPRLTPAQRSANRYKRFDLETIGLVLSNGKTRLASILVLTVTSALSQIECVLAIYLWQRFRYDGEVTGILFAVMSLIILFIQTQFLRKIATQFGAIQTIALGAGISACGLLIFVSSRLSFLVVGSLAMFAAGQSLIMPTLSTFALQGAPADSKAADTAVYRSVGSLARIISPPFAGWLFENLSWRSPFLASLAAMISAASLASFWMLVRKPQV